MKLKTYKTKIYWYLIENDKLKSSYEVAKFHDGLNNTGRYKNALVELVDDGVVIKVKDGYVLPKQFRKVYSNQKNKKKLLKNKKLLKGIFNKNVDYWSKELPKLLNK